MGVDVFTYSPLNGATGDFSRRTRTASFADGYEQVTGDGMNSEKQSWPLTFTDTWAEIKPISDFLRAHGEDKAFQWTNPIEEKGLYRATQLKMSALGFGKWTLTVTFVTAYKV